MSRFPSGTSFSVNISPNKTVANNTPTSITLHWWDDPSRRPSFGGVVSWFNNRSAQVSAHYVVEANRITQMVLEKDTAWHSGNSNGNRLSVGIEVNPRLNAGDYEATAQLVAEIWSRLGKIPVRRHSYWTNTACPGSMDVNRIIRRAEQIRSGGSSSPAPAQPPRTPATGGSTMATPRQIWSYSNSSVQKGRQVFNFLRFIPRDVWARTAARDFVNGDSNANSYGFMVSRIHEYAHGMFNRVWGRREKPTQATADRWEGVRKDGYLMKTWLKYCYSWARRSFDRATEVRGEVRELKAMVKAMAEAQDKNTGRILDAVNEAEREAIQVNARDVAAELAIDVKDNEEDED